MRMQSLRGVTPSAQGWDVVGKSFELQVEGIPKGSFFFHII